MTEAEASLTRYGQPAGLDLLPALEQRELSSRLDYYKLTMSQLAFEKEPAAQVSFELLNRGEQKLADFSRLDELEYSLERFRQKGWSEAELRYLGILQLGSGEPVFSQAYLDYLAGSKLPAVQLSRASSSSDLEVKTTGEWPSVTFWETTILSEINELYFDNYLQAKGLDPEAIYDEGDRRLSEKIFLLRGRPGIKFVDMGTRRHFSARWQRHVLERLARECPANFIGTSNVGLAKDLGLKPIGTFAHEMPMVYAALADQRGQDIRATHGKFLDDWYARYGQDLSVGLSDTFGSDFFLADFGDERAESWRGLRQDSANPFAFGEKAIAFYQQKGIDTLSKTIVFSVGLDIDRILDIYEHFEGRIGMLFGWGTTLTNDLGLKALNVVMKATWVNGVGTVKLSDSPGKHTGRPAQIKRYQEIFKP